MQGLLTFFSLNFKVRFEKSDLTFGTLDGLGLEGREGSGVEVVGVRYGLCFCKGTLVPCVIGEEDVVFEKGMCFGPLEGFSCPGFNDSLVASFVMKARAVC